VIWLSNLPWCGCFVKSWDDGAAGVGASEEVATTAAASNTAACTTAEAGMLAFSEVTWDESCDAADMTE
jgi:hypothetical protein